MSDLPATTDAAPPAFPDTLPDDHPLADAPDLVPGSRALTKQGWYRAALMLGAGLSLDETAKELGISRMTLWRARRSAPAFAARIEVERMIVTDKAEVEFQRLRGHVVAALYDLVGQRDRRTVLWMADRLGLGLMDAAAPDNRPRATDGSIPLEQVPGSANPPLFAPVGDCDVTTRIAEPRNTT